MNKGSKLIRLFKSSAYISYLLRVGVAAAVEHEKVLTGLGCATVVDIGANRGQFALVARRCFPTARIISFEPLSAPAQIFRRGFKGDDRVSLHEAAISPKAGVRDIYISARDDSSSLLPITENQVALFPGTAEHSRASIKVAPLSSIVTEEIAAPALMKMDVQGYELEALKGAEDLLRAFRYIYVECSFRELYEGQSLADEVVIWLVGRGFRWRGVYNITYDDQGHAIQGDFMFESALGD